MLSNVSSIAGCINNNEKEHKNREKKMTDREQYTPGPAHAYRHQKVRVPSGDHRTL